MESRSSRSKPTHRTKRTRQKNKKPVYGTKMTFFDENEPTNKSKTIPTDELLKRLDYLAQNPKELSEEEIIKERKLIKNRLGARKNRAKTKNKIDTLEQSIHDHKHIQDELKLNIASTQTENEALKKRAADLSNQLINFAAKNPNAELTNEIFALKDKLKFFSFYSNSMNIYLENKDEKTLTNINEIRKKI
ncbi:MAG: hypothetical protein JO149_07940 [Gammaproteobacteria bacterium]|nr:hypothetical protein [Gammaproteobacteria bacterium]